MKGILNKIESGWVVSYRTDDMNIDSYDNLPLFPNTELIISLEDGKQVEFEIIDEFTHPSFYKVVGWGDGIKYAKLINIENTWDEIFEKYPVFENGRYRSLKQYLSENYNVPTKK